MMNGSARRWFWPALSLLLTLSTATSGWLAVRYWLRWQTAESRYAALLASIPPEAFDRTAARLAGPAAGASAGPAAGASAGLAAPTGGPAAPAPSAAATAKAVSVADVDARYRPRFLAMQADCEGRLNAPIEQARKEALALQTLGGSITELIPKYEKLGSGLKLECDGRFQAVAGLLKAELTAYNLPLDLVAQAEQTYSRLIKAKQAELMAKVTRR